MGVIRAVEVTPETIAPNRERYLTHTDNLMVVVMDFKDGPTKEPDPPHSHPHEQISYVVAGEVLFYLGDEPTRMGPGDLVTVPPDMPHTVQLLSPYVRLVDTFHPLREEFLK